MRQRRRARIGVGNRCTPQRLFQLEFRRAQPARVSIHRHRDLPKSGRAARRVGDFGKPFCQRLRRDRYSGVSIGPALHRCRKGHPEVVRRDRKIGGTSAVSDQRRRTSRSDANRRQRMRDHRHQRAICSRSSHGFDDSSTCANAEGFTILHAADEMIGHGCHRPRRRATQYSRGVSDRIEKPRRTGSPAFAGDDKLAEPLTLDHPNALEIEQMRAKAAARELDRESRRGQQNACRHRQRHGADPVEPTGVSSSQLPA